MLVCLKDEFQLDQLRAVLFGKRDDLAPVGGKPARGRRRAGDQAAQIRRRHAHDVAKRGLAGEAVGFGRDQVGTESFVADASLRRFDHICLSDLETCVSQSERLPTLRHLLFVRPDIDLRERELPVCFDRAAD